MSDVRPFAEADHLSQIERKLRARRGEPPDNGDMEARIAKLEATVEHIQADVKELKDDVRALRADINSIRTTDFRLMFGALIVTALGLASMMARGFHWL